MKSKIINADEVEDGTFAYEAGEDDEGGEPADEVAQQQYEFLSTAGQTQLYSDPNFQNTILSISKASDPAVAAGQVVGRLLLMLVGKAEDDSGAQVDQGAIETAAQDLLELLYDDLITAGVYSEQDDENEFAEAAYHSAYGEFVQGRVSEGRMSEEDLQAQAEDMRAMVAAGEVE